MRTILYYAYQHVMYVHKNISHTNRYIMYTHVKYNAMLMQQVVLELAGDTSTNLHLFGRTEHSQ